MEDLGGQPILKTIIERAKKANSLDELVVAVPYEERGKFEVLMDWGCQLSSPAVPQHDLIARFHDTAKTYDADLVVRLNGDNPFVEASEIDRAVECFVRRPCLFVSNMHQHPIRVMEPYSDKNGYPDGIGCEVFSLSRLQWMCQELRDPYSREHPHQIFHRFKIVSSPLCPEAFARPDIKLDVNTEADLEELKILLFETGKSPTEVHITDLIQAWDRVMVKSG